MTERKILATKLIATHVLLLPMLLTLTIIYRNYKILLLGIDQAILLILYFAGYWEFFGTRFKHAFLALCQVFIVVLLAEGFASDRASSVQIIGFVLFTGIELWLLILLGKILYTIFHNDKEPVEISFPFRTGSYLITDGGNSKVSRLMNYHFHSTVHKKKKTNFSMLYATDVVKISMQHTKFLPTTNESYPVFGTPVYSPINGTIVKVVDDINDNVPYTGNYPYNTGNTVVIQNNLYYFLLGHLKRGTIAVKVGDKVNANDYLGEAGNSGMSERPHLHMQLMRCDGADFWKGTGLNIRYQEKNLFKNRLLRI